jgi:hypothetical protein
LMCMPRIKRNMRGVGQIARGPEIRRMVSRIRPAVTASLNGPGQGPRPKHVLVVSGTKRRAPVTGRNLRHRPVPPSIRLLRSRETRMRGRPGGRLKPACPRAGDPARATARNAGGATLVTASPQTSPHVTARFERPSSRLVRCSVTRGFAIFVTGFCHSEKARSVKNWGTPSIQRFKCNRKCRIVIE